ncbi:MAG: tRNA (N6-isopentenyl adenosine(37)-C2)-methylthiotransferase MiaB [Polyangiaceae bacterium]|nr:tRNA (N6-isopentenyl adenosine(37)-C2)-methylthiotransferase MiaB [Polyangiaceae bacterium]
MATEATVDMDRFFIRTMGCQMNVHDSERAHEILCDAGLTPADSPEDADLIVVNTCSVREKAEAKLDSELGKLRRLKASSQKVLVVAGCVAKQRGKAMLDRMPFLDAVVGPDNLAQLPRIAFESAAGAARVVATDWDIDRPSFLGTRVTGVGVRPSMFVSVSKGCSERCSFCIVPSTRGPERHRAATEIVGEIRHLVSAGVLEVILLGQTVNNYQDPVGELGDRPSNAKSDFAALLRKIARDVPELLRLRYTSPHPRFFDGALIEAHRDLDVLCRHLHMPVQSGSDLVLRRMIRRHTREEFLGVVSEMRRVRGDITVSTDLIVGFPGETDVDFEQTLGLMRDVPFVGVYAFKYSPRPGTPALVLGDDVDEVEKSGRLSRVFEVSEFLMGEHLRGLVGTEQLVLLEEPNPRGDGGVSGHTDRNEIVHVEAGSGLRVGDGVVKLRIVRAYKHSLVGEYECAEAGGGLQVRRRLPVLPLGI